MLCGIASTFTWGLLMAGGMKKKKKKTEKKQQLCWIIANRLTKR